MIAADFSHNNELISFPQKSVREVSSNTTENNDLESSNEEFILQKSQVIFLIYIFIILFLWLLF